MRFADNRSSALLICTNGIFFPQPINAKNFG
jgi:hypothetical protein